jgi:hypothetical protein
MNALLTLEALEALAAQVETDSKAERARLLRLCAAMVRILAVRQPGVFRRGTTRITSESTSDSSYPPELEYTRGHSAPRVLRIRDAATTDVPLESGFYHPWERDTEEAGCYVSDRGHWYGRIETGTGHYAAFAAYPGDTGVDVRVEWVRIEPDLADIQAAVELIRSKMSEFLDPELAAS